VDSRVRETSSDDRDGGEMNLDPLGGPGLRVSARGRFGRSRYRRRRMCTLRWWGFCGGSADGTVLACPIEQAIWTDW